MRWKQTFTVHIFTKSVLILFDNVMYGEELNIYCPYVCVFGHGLIRALNLNILIFLSGSGQSQDRLNVLYLMSLSLYNISSKNRFESTDSWLNVVRRESWTGCQVGSEIGKVWHWTDKVNRSGISLTTSKSNDQLPSNSRTHLSNFRSQSSIVSDSWKRMGIGQFVKLQSRSFPGPF